MSEESTNTTRTTITKEDLPTIAKKLGISSSWCKNDEFLKMMVNMIYAFAMQTRADPDAGVGTSCLSILVGMDAVAINHLVEIHEFMETTKEQHKDSRRHDTQRIKDLKGNLERTENETETHRRHAETFETITHVLGMVIQRDERLARYMEQNRR
tara:strand:- start:439 stop:903 length:465 start_codon:yes stop_codon:yes gene_type:complete